MATRTSAAQAAACSFDAVWGGGHDFCCTLYASISGGTAVKHHPTPVLRNNLIRKRGMAETPPASVLLNLKADQRCTSLLAWLKNGETWDPFGNAREQWRAGMTVTVYQHWGDHVTMSHGADSNCILGTL